MSTPARALITGSSRGIGREIALSFAREGYEVIINYHRDDAAARTTANEASLHGPTPIIFRADVSDPHAVSDMVSTLTGERPIDVLIANAGICTTNPIPRTSEDEWDTTLSTNLTGVFYLLRAWSRAMRSQRRGAAITVGSLAGLRGLAGNAAYAASKGGLISLTKTAARELGRFSLRLNTVLPGFHQTDMGATAARAQYIQAARAESVLGTTTDIAELASFIVFLAQTKTVSGQVFNWDSRII